MSYIWTKETHMKPPTTVKSSPSGALLKRRSLMIDKFIQRALLVNPRGLRFLQRKMSSVVSKRPALVHLKDFGVCHIVNPW